jgi:hypothetical protein
LLLDFDRASNSTREWSPCISCIACISPWQTTKQAAICATFWKIEDESNFEEQFLYISARSESPEEAQRRREAELQRKGSEQRGSPQEVESEPRIISSPNLASYDKLCLQICHMSALSVLLSILPIFLWMRTLEDWLLIDSDVTMMLDFVL